VFTRIATWLVALPVPDPELQCELMVWAALLFWAGSRVAVTARAT
jgi:hypothetical protein